MLVAADTRHGNNDQSTRPRFVLVPLEAALDASLTDGAFRTFCVLRKYCYGRRNVCWPSLRTLAADRNCSQETIRRHVRELSVAGMLSVERRGRGNRYVFPEMSAPPAVGNEVVKPTNPHTDVGRRLSSKENLETSSLPPPRDDVSAEIHNPQAPATRLVANGVSPDTAERLVRQYGAQICEQALALLGRYDVRNPGGWLYCAITQGFVKPAVARSASLPKPSPPMSTEPPEAHVERLKQRRREALARRGITAESQALWERVCARLRAEEDWSPALTAAYLRPVGEREYAVMGPAGAVSAKLRALLPAVTAALQVETGLADCRATVPAAGPGDLVTGPNQRGRSWRWA